MIEVTTLSDFRGRDRETFRSESAPPRDLVNRFWRPDWQNGDRVSVIVDGRALRETDLDIPTPEGSQVILVPTPEGEGFLTYLVINLIVAAVSAVISYQLQPRPKLKALDRGDESSQTYQYAIGTEYRQGFPRPIVFGRHDVGGTVIYLDVSPIGSGANEQFNMVLALSRGPIHAIGGIKEDWDALGGWPGGPAGVGLFPSSVRLNGAVLPNATLNASGAYAFTRRGSLGQDPLPDSYSSVRAFPGVTTTLLINKEVPDLGASDFSFTPTHDTGELSILLHYPSGVYATHATTGATLESFPAYQVDVFNASAQVIYTGLHAHRARTQSPMTWEEVISPVPMKGGELYTIRITEQPNFPSLNNVNTAVFRQLKYSQPSELAYPQTALLGLVARGGDNIAGGRPNVVTNVSGVPVRVWDSTILGGLPSAQWVDGEQVPRQGSDGWYWDEPALGSVYAAIWQHPPGQNCSWLAVEFATNPRWGMGARFDDDRIDWPAWRDFADWCDRDVAVGAETEVGNTCNFVLDQPTKGWEVLMRLCAAGRGVPIMVGDKLSVRYNYSAAHGRGTNVVPAKAATQVVSSANVSNFQVTYLNPQARPGMVSMQILDEDGQYSQTTVSKEDPDGDFHNPVGFRPDPYRKDTIDGFGITRKTQATREILFLHRANRLVASQVSFDIGPEALAATIGDVIAVQHHAMRPFDTESFGYRAFETTNTTSIKIDHEVTLSSSESYSFAARLSDGSFSHLSVVASTSGTFAAGAAIPITVTADIKKGAPVVFGITSKTTKSYEIREITLGEDLIRSVVAHEYHAEVYEDIDVGDPAAFDSGSASVSPGVVPADVFTENKQEPSVPITATITRGLSPTKHTIGFAGDLSTTNGTVGNRARFYGKPSTETEFSFLGQSASSSIEVEGLAPHTLYDLAVCQPNALGYWPPPALGLTVEGVRVPEFPAFTPPAVGGLRATVVFEGHFLTWDHADFDGFTYYEVRETAASDPHWHGAQFIGRTTNPQMQAPPIRGTAWIVRARHRSGQWSDATVLAGSGLPQNESELTAFVDYTLTGLAYTNVTDNSGILTLDSGHTDGSFTATVTLLSSQEARLFIPGYSWWDDEITLDEIDEEFALTVGTGEMNWWQIDGREASPEYPGCDFDLTWDEIDSMSPADQEALGAGGARPGFEGDRARVRIMVSYDSGPYEIYRPVRKVWAAAAVRIEFDRCTTRITTAMAGVSLRVFTR